MLDQNDMDRLSRLTENDFRAILTAVEGGIDYEFMIMLLEGYYFDRALKMCKEGCLMQQIGTRKKQKRLETLE